MVNITRLLLLNFIVLNLILINFIGLISGYAPKLVLFSFDGFRSDFLHKELTPTMYELSKKGIQTKMMKSCYATKTFPNHFSIATGLYEENHGIVNNKMYDPKLNSNFTQPNLEEVWWNDMKVDPIWNVNEQFNEDHISASSMWPGSPVKYNGKSPKHLQKYERGISFIERMDQAIEWLVLDNDPANFVMVYIDEPDEVSHHNGPFSPATRKILKDLDDAVKYFLKRLTEVDLINETNIIILSDHGMSEAREDRVIDLTELFDSKEAIVSGVSPNLMLFLKNKDNLDKIYDQLKKASKNLPFVVYKKGEVPSQYHFNNHRRIGDLVLEADDGYEIVIKKDPFPFNRQNVDEVIRKKRAEIYGPESDNSANHNKLDIIGKFEDFLERKKNTTLKIWGEHGYNNSIPNMRPLFLASGPAFRKKYVHMTPFQNIDIYPMICRVLHLDLDKSLKPNDRYCKMDGKLSRVKKMLVDIKYTGDTETTPSDDQSFNSKEELLGPKTKCFLYIIGIICLLSVVGSFIYALYRRSIIKIKQKEQIVQFRSG